MYVIIVYYSLAKKIVIPNITGPSIFFVIVMTFVKIVIIWDQKGNTFFVRNGLEIVLAIVVTTEVD